MDDWIEKNVVYLHYRVLLSHKKNGTFSSVAKWIQPESILLSEK